MISLLNVHPHDSSSACLMCSKNKGQSIWHMNHSACSGGFHSHLWLPTCSFIDWQELAWDHHSFTKGAKHYRGLWPWCLQKPSQPLLYRDEGLGFFKERNMKNMKSMLLCLWAFTLFSAIGLVHCQFHSTTEIPLRQTQKKTSLHFFLHHSFKSSKPSSVIVAGANSSTGNNGLLSPFGTVHVLDEPLTEGPEPTSKVIGNAHGLLVSSGLKELPLAV